MNKSMIAGLAALTGVSCIVQTEQLGSSCESGTIQICPYTGPPGTSGVGACRAGIKTCNTDGDGWGSCQGEVLPIEETCSTPVDDDCDGLVNEDGMDCTCAPEDLVSCYGGPPGTAEVGLCRSGVRVCNAQGTGFGACVGQVLPTVEDCATTSDEDCDGVVNQGCTCKPNEVVACYFGPSGTDGVGACATGTQVCNALGTSLGPCEGEVLPALEQCGTVTDENCDGTSYCNGNHLWSLRFGDGTSQEALTVAVDSSGNVVVGGGVQGTTDFGNGPLVSTGGNDAFLAKFNALGSPLWSKRFGDANEQAVLDVAIDASGDVTAVGSLVGTVDFGGGVLTSNGGQDLFVVKLDSAGNHKWSRRFGDASDQKGFSLAVDGAGSVIVTGYFGGSMDFAGGSIVSKGAEDIFLLKLDAEGNDVWAMGFGDASIQVGRDVAVDGLNNVVLTGYFSGIVDFGGGPLPSAGKDDIFVAKYSPAGSHVWSKRFGDPLSQSGYGLAVDGSGCILITGGAYGTLDFGGGPLTSNGGADIFLAKLDSAGSHVWSRLYGDGVGSQYGSNLTVDGGGNVVLGYNLDGAVDFGGGSLASAGLLDAGVAKFNSDGANFWSKRFGGPNNDDTAALAIDTLGNVIAVGGFQSSIDLGGGTLLSPGGYDIFLAKLAP